MDSNNIIIDYGNDATVEDFIAMRSTLDYYTSLINAQELSPVEKTMYAYDLVKSYAYSNTGKKITSLGRKESMIHSIIKEGNIVCGGYSAMLKQILEEVGINSTTVSIKSQQRFDRTPDQYEFVDPMSTGHARTLVKIDDEKYDINGMFSLDATWDSNDKQQQGLDFYTHFLTAPSNYKEVFPDDSYPNLYSHIWGHSFRASDNLKKLRENPKALATSELISPIKELFGELVSDEVLEIYSKTPGLTKEQFQQILYTVRMAQGYGEKAIEEVERLSSIYYKESGMSKAA